MVWRWYNDVHYDAVSVGGRDDLPCHRWSTQIYQRFDSYSQSLFLIIYSCNLKRIAVKYFVHERGIDTWTLDSWNFFSDWTLVGF